MQRRSFIRSAFGILIAAPMVVKAENIMRVKPPSVSSKTLNFGRNYSSHLDLGKPGEEFTFLLRCHKPEKNALYLVNYYDEQKKAHVEEFFDFGEVGPAELCTVIKYKGADPVGKVYSIDGGTRSIVRHDFIPRRIESGELDYPLRQS